MPAPALPAIRDEAELIGLCVRLVGSEDQLTAAEKRLAGRARETLLLEDMAQRVRNDLQAGLDPLGTAFIGLRSATSRRELGAIYTPDAIVRTMVDWVAARSAPDRIVDPGAGSGRFILEAGRTFPRAELVAAEIDPLATLILRANAAALGWGDRLKIVLGDFRSIRLAPIAGVTAFVGNPPYVRHHSISEDWKTWYVQEFARLGIAASALAGLHAHFFLKTVLLGRPGDIGAFVTSAEWIDVNYGSALRHLFAHQLGGVSLHVLQASVQAFPGTATSAAISCFAIGGDHDKVKLKSVERLSALRGLSAGRSIPRKELAASVKWSLLVRPSGRVLEQGDTEIGELFRVHRGQVTGANGIWIAGAQADQLPESIRIPTVTRARDLLSAGADLSDSGALRRVIDIPSDLSVFDDQERQQIEHFLAWAKSAGADQGYIARHRKQWWSVGLKSPAPILCTYMARRPPQFTLNSCDARHINIAHGLYPRQAMYAASLRRMVNWLNENVCVSHGRVYSGGLTKFEPREVERLRFPKELLDE